MADKELIAIYRAQDSLWIDACAWAKLQGMERFVDNESCYRAMNYRATMFYADDEKIISEYALRNIPRLKDKTLLEDLEEADE